MSATGAWSGTSTDSTTPALGNGGMMGQAGMGTMNLQLVQNSCTGAFNNGQMTMNAGAVRPATFPPSHRGSFGSSRPQKGTFDLHCRFHAMIQGILTVTGDRAPGWSAGPTPIDYR